MSRPRYPSDSPEVTRAYSAKARAADPEKANAAQRAWYHRNKHKKQAAKGQRRAKKLCATPAWFERQAIGLVYLKAQELGLEVDHIVPLNSRIVSGLHVHANLQLLAPSENRAKGNRIWPDHPEEHSTKS